MISEFISKLIEGKAYEIHRNPLLPGVSYSICIVGPPGCGKTQALARVINSEMATHMPIPGLPESQLEIPFLATSFSRAATAELRDRVPFHSSGIRTIYSAASFLLTMRRKLSPKPGDRDLKFLSLRPGSEHHQALKRRGLDLAQTRQPGSQPTRGSDLMMAFNLKRHNPTLTWNAIADSLTFCPPAAELRRLFGRFESFMAESHLVDFVRCLELAIEEEVSYTSCDYVFLDEAQDLTPLEWRAFDTIFANAEVLVHVGDPAQSVHRWRGADPATFTNRVAASSAAYQLARTHRNKKVIVDYAQLLLPRMRHIKDRHAVTPAAPGGTIVRTRNLSHVIEQMELTPPEETWLVLGRNRQYVELAGKQLVSNGLLIGSCGNLRRWLPEENESSGSRYHSGARLHNAFRVVSRIVQKGTLGPQEEDIETLDAFLKIEAWQDRKLRRLRPEVIQDFRSGEVAKWFRLNPIRAALLDNWIQREGIAQVAADPAGHRIRLMTLHASKGRQADHVAILGDWSKRSYQSLGRHDTDEHPLAFVGVTRARETVYLVAPARSGRSYPWPEPAETTVPM